MPKKESNEMTNFYTHPKMKEFLEEHENPHFEDHQIKTPFRMMVVAASGGGKTTCLLNMIQKMSDTYFHIHILHKTEEPIYSFLQKMISPKRITFYTKISDLPSINDFPNKGKPQLVVFDDFVNECAKTQAIIAEFYVRGRKRMLSMAYLSQSYFKVPKIIRLNINYLILLKLSSDRDLKLIVSDYGLGIDKNEIFKMYKDATSNQFDFLKIDIDCNDNNKRFSKNWKGFYRVEDDSDNDD